MNNTLRFKDEAEAKAFFNRNAQPKKKSQPFPGPVEFKDPYKNNTEREYASYLDALKHMKEIVWWAYEAWGFRIADNTFIYPDFAIAYKTHIEIHDTKGHVRPQWWVKFKTLKEICPIFRYATVKKEKGEWKKYYL